MILVARLCLCAGERFPAYAVDRPQGQKIWRANLSDRALDDGSACCSLAEATTSSLEALKAYSLGAKARNEKGYAAALPYHQRAIQLDPNFAMGYRTTIRL